MSLLWVYIGLIIVAALALITMPLLRKRKTKLEARESFDVAIYKDQLVEAEREFGRGLLNTEQVEAVKIEIQRKLLAASNASKDHQKSKTNNNTTVNLITAFGLVIFITVGSVGVYSYLGTPTLDNLAYADRDIEQEQQAQGDQTSIAEMADLIERLEQRLQTEPDNLEGWLMLGRSSVSVGQYTRAVKAYEHAVALAPENSQILVDYAETISFLNEGRVTDNALTALNKAHALSPAEPKARYYLALAQAQKGDLKSAVQEWVDLLAISLPDAPWIGTVRAQIDSAAKEDGIDLATVTASQEAVRIGTELRQTANAQPSAPGPSRQDVEAASQMSAGDRQQMIRSMVQRLADRLEKSPDDRQGWLKLANAYKVLGETAKAKEAMERANALNN